MTAADRRMRTLGVALFIAAFAVAFIGTRGAGGTVLASASLALVGIFVLNTSGAFNK